MVYPLTRAQGKAASRSDTARRLGEVAELEMAAYENCRCESQVSTSADGETSSNGTSGVARSPMEEDAWGKALRRWDGGTEAQTACGRR
ncbi:hypothetical protein EYC84_011037 [Monilinia fructicola]|uniref:Uncharacterized protein n=1 Tax=Monilinia fructicola TaxID=38448 RepID=A0A5M9JCD3_MONFR|nr:hypothetical protein EYC84_011037 [Monilinia fructicola]